MTSHESTMARVREIHGNKRNAIADLIRAAYFEKSKGSSVSEVSAGLDQQFRDVLIETDALTGHFFSDNFSIDGLPVVSPDDLGRVIEKFGVQEGFSQFIKDILMTQDTGNQNVSPLYTRFIGMGAQGSVKRFDSNFVSLRGNRYYSSDPEVRREVRASGSIVPGIQSDYDLFEQATAANLQAAKVGDTAEGYERVVLAAPMDHMKNMGLVYLNTVQLIAHSKANPELLTSGLKFEGNRSSMDAVYKDLIEQWLESDAVQTSDVTQATEFAKVYESIANLVKAYHLFLLDGDPRHLAVTEPELEQVNRLISASANSASAFEAVVESSGLSSKMQARMKRELFKRLFRHERDADHPGINMLQVAQFVGDTDKKRVVLGVAYGGIEYPFIYDALREYTTGAHAESTSERGFILLSNYNLQYRPKTAPLVEKHLYPISVAEEGHEADEIIVFDDNAVTGLTRLQIIEMFVSEYGSKPVIVACADVNTNPDSLRDREALRNGVLNLGRFASRSLLQRPHGMPKMLSPSRYAMPHKPVR